MRRCNGQIWSRPIMQPLACDPVSAFGGIIALNRPLDGQQQQKSLKSSPKSLSRRKLQRSPWNFAAKKNVRVLETGGLPNRQINAWPFKQFRAAGYFKHPTTGISRKMTWKIVTKRAPTEQELKDLLFAFRICKHVKSNAIVLHKTGQSVGIGAGQMSRIDSSRIAAEGQRSRNNHPKLCCGLGRILPSWWSLAAADAGQPSSKPGGSIKDEDVIKAADERGLAMVRLVCATSGIRN